MSTITTKSIYANLEPRDYQLYVEEALELRIADLLCDVDGQRHLSRADIILIYTIYPGALQEFLDDYLEYVRTEQKQKGYTVIKKPHYYLKDIIG